MNKRCLMRVDNNDGRCTRKSVIAIDGSGYCSQHGYAILPPIEIKTGSKWRELSLAISWLETLSKEMK